MVEKAQQFQEDFFGSPSIGHQKTPAKLKAASEKFSNQIQAPHFDQKGPPGS